MSIENPKHVVIDAKTGAFVCEHCGATLTVKLPCNVLEFAAACRSFVDRHAQCERPIQDGAR